MLIAKLISSIVIFFSNNVSALNVIRITHLEFCCLFPLSSVVGGALHSSIISHGKLSIEITGTDEKSKSKKIIHIEQKTTLKDLAEALNAFNVGPEDLISIIQALKKNGSLIGRIELI